MTLASLAAELGVTPAALLRHYPSRDAILEAVAARAAELVASTMPPAGLSPLERLAWLAKKRSALLGANVGLARLLFSEQFALALPEEAVKRLRGLVRKNREFIVTALREGAERKEVRSDVPPEELATIVMGTLQAMAFFAAGAFEMNKVHPERVWAGLVTLLSPPPQRRRS